MKFISLLLFCLWANFSSANSRIGLWEWPENSDSQTFSINIKQEDSYFIGSYCAVAMSGNRIDCDHENTFRFSNPGSEFFFKSNYSGKTGKAIITFSEHSLTWKIIEPPSEEYYAPLNAQLIKTVSNNRPVSEVACLAQLYEFGKSYSPILMGEESTTETFTEKNQYVENEIITVSTTKNKTSWMKTRECNSCNPKKFITDLFLKDFSKNIPCNLNFGVTVKYIESKLGTPDEITEAGYHIYFYPMIEKNQSIALHFNDGLLDTIYWQFYWD